MVTAIQFSLHEYSHTLNEVSSHISIGHLYLKTWGKSAYAKLQENVRPNVKQSCHLRPVAIAATTASICSSENNMIGNVPQKKVKQSR